MFGDLGFGNVLRIEDAALAENMRRVQKRNALPVTSDDMPRQFSIEMETGTGKTYVYTKTIFELHRRFGFTKYIVVVPSVAIREGVYKSFQVTAEHFALQYDNVPCHFFIYDSAKLSDVRQFATKAKDAIASLHPLCVLRYSATHREKLNLLYRLTPVDAYQTGLVKQISLL